MCALRCNNCSHFRCHNSCKEHQIAFANLLIIRISTSIKMTRMQSGWKFVYLFYLNIRFVERVAQCTFWIKLCLFLLNIDCIFSWSEVTPKIEAIYWPTRFSSGHMVRIEVLHCLSFPSIPTWVKMETTDTSRSINWCVCRLPCRRFGSWQLAVGKLAFIYLYFVIYWASGTDEQPMWALLRAAAAKNVH